MAVAGRAQEPESGTGGAAESGQVRVNAVSSLGITGKIVLDFYKETRN